MPHPIKQLRDIARAMRFLIRHNQLENGSVEELAEYQDEQLKRVVRHAASNSNFLAALYRDIDVEGDFELEDLPIVDKRMMMENFDEWVVDPHLNLAGIERQIENDPEEQYYLGEYRIVATAGSSGLRGIFVYDREEWSVVIAAALRWAAMFNISPVGLSYRKLASVKADSPMHATSRLGQSMDLGIRNLLMLDATEPIESIVGKLNEFQPQLFMGYASLISLLAEEQIAGRLDISPEMIATFSEILDDARIRRVRKAWGITPFNHYGAAEQIMIAADCDAHQGLHHFADMSIVEIVDMENRPVPVGTPGDKILLTNLHKFVQPIIRYEVTDLVSAAPGRCTCDRPFPLFSQIGGRAEDVLVLPGKAGRTVSISPMLIFDCMVENADVIEYQYTLAGNSLCIRIVPRMGSDKSKLEDAVRQTVTATLSEHGATGFAIEIEFVRRIVRSKETMGKLKLSDFGQRRVLNSPA